jgi:hypothetical protein
MSLGNNANLNGFVPFPSNNVWNTNIASAPVDPNSAAITRAPGFARLSLHPDFGAESIYGIPYVVVDSSITPSVPINVIDYPSEGDVVVAPYPATAPIEGGLDGCTGWPDTYEGDAHVLVLDRARCELYETYNTHHCNGLWNASGETIWDMRNYETRPWGWSSSDAAGLPIFPGLVRYDEIASGAIPHALRFTMQQTKNDANNGYFVYPASHAAGNYWGVSNVMGMRIRLKASFDISGYSKVNQIILTAMKQYGMILADNGGYFFFQGVSDPRFDDNDLDNLKMVASSNFEVVQATPEFPGYDSATAPAGAAPVINSFTASASTLGSGSPVTFSYDVSGDSYDFIDVIGPVTAGSGSVTAYPAATQTYTLNSTNAYGRSTSSLTVTVSGSQTSSPTFSPAAGTFSSAQAVTLSDNTPGAVIYYATSGTPTTSSTKYTGALTVSSTETIHAIAAATGYANSAVNSATYTINLPPPPPSTAAAPTFNLAIGTYNSVQTVTLSDTTPGAVIYYTTSGTPTTSSTKYTGALTVSSTKTIYAIAAATGYANSAVSSATYTINLPAPDFSVAASPASMTVNAGSVGTTTISVTPLNGFSSEVSFSCAGLPSGATCGFSPATVTPSGAAASTTLTVTASTATAALGRNDRPLLSLAVLAGVLFCFGGRKRRHFQMLLLLAVSAIGLSLLSGCNSMSIAPQASASTITVSATSGSLRHAATVSLTVN